MKLQFKDLLDQNYPPESRVWVFQCNRLFSENEKKEIEEILKDFTANWKSHGNPIKGTFNIFFDRFIVLIADGSIYHICGGSLDSSTRLMKELEENYSIKLMDRMSFAFALNETDSDYRVLLIQMNELRDAIEKGTINGDTLFFNNLVDTKKELEESWILPVKNSWLTKKVSFINAVH